MELENVTDERYAKVEADKNAAMNEVDTTYNGMINDSDSYYQAQIDASNQWAETQAKNQQERTDFTIEQIEQQKEQARKDYIKEQSGSYVDWQKQSNNYGANAEQMAANGMTNSGYSESSQVSMYNTYQNRVATARESYNRAVLNYDNAIKDARLQNNSILAEIAYNALQTQLQLSLEGFQYKNNLIIDRMNARMNVENTYYQRSQDVLSQINTEKALAEQIRQFNEEMGFQREQFAWQKEQAAKSSSGGGGSRRSSGVSGQEIEENEEPKVEKEGGSNLTVDTKSVLNLGLGPISGKKLDDLVSQGAVTSTVVGNKLVFEWNPNRTTGR